MTPAPHRVSLDLPCVHKAVRVGRRVVQSFARTEELADEEIERLMLVVSELLANAVDHGGGGGAFEEDDLDGDVRMLLRLELDAAGWRLEIEDQGGGERYITAELMEEADRSCPIDLEDERGRGLFLVSEMVSGMSVRHGAAGLIVEVHRELGRG